MSNKKLTPHQLRQGLSYVQEGKPDFMKMLTGQSLDASSSSNASHYKKPIGIEAKFQHENDDEDEDDDGHDLLNMREEERPTVVVLKDGKHLDERQARNVLKNLPAGQSEAEIREALEKAEAEGSTSSEEDESAAVDDSGKILFRKPKKKTSKASAGTDTATEGAGGSKKRTLEESLLGEARQKVEALKKKKRDDSKQGGSSSTSSNSKKGAKKSKATPKSLLSFDDEE